MAAGAGILVSVGVVGVGPRLLLLLHSFLCSFSEKCVYMNCCENRETKRGEDEE